MFDILYIHITSVQKHQLVQLLCKGDLEQLRDGVQVYSRVCYTEQWLQSVTFYRVVTAGYLVTAGQPRLCAFVYDSLLACCHGHHIPAPYTRFLLRGRRVILTEINMQSLSD